MTHRSQSNGERDPSAEWKDFFISYTQADQAWAEWIAWTLEEAGHSVVIQVWDFRPGENFVLKMQRVLSETQKTIAVLSDAYLQSAYASSEWTATFVDDAQSTTRPLIPIRVDACQPQALLKTIVYVDLVGLDETAAKQAVLAMMAPRVKPEQPPIFPGTAERTVLTHPKFPGAATPDQTPDVKPVEIAPHPPQTETSKPPWAIVSWMLQLNAKTAIAGLILLVAIWGSWQWLARPWLSSWYNDRGLDLDQQEQLGQAEEVYLRAITLNPDNLDAHYNLGNLYEDMQQLDKARQSYLIAAKGAFPEADNNLARLDIKAKQYERALEWIDRGLHAAAHLDSPPQVLYSLHKNLGWVRFQQGDNVTARASLEWAIGMATDPNTPEITNRGGAHCLLAQVLERQQQPNALEHWQKCCQLSPRLNPEEKTWVNLARQKLHQGGQSCERP